MYRKTQVLGFTLLVGVFGAAFQAAATTITTTSYSTWSSPADTTGSQTFVDLESLTAGMNYSTASGYTSNGYTFTGPDGAGYYLYAENASSTTGLEGKSDGVGVIQVAMPNAGNSAFFFDAVCESCGTLSLTLSDGENFTVSNGQFGISVSHDITWFDLGTSSGTQPFLEYVYFGTSSLPPDSPAASEAATPVLVGGGLMVLIGAGRKKLLRRA
jgi:hypothetical protein